MAAAVAGKDSSGGGKDQVVDDGDLATVAIVGVSDPVRGRRSSQRADPVTGILNQGLGELRAL